MSTINKLVYGALTFTDDQIQDGEVYEAMALLSDALEIGTLRAELYIRDETVGAALTSFRRNDKLLYYYRDELRGTYYIESVQRTGKYTYELSANNAVALLEQSSHMGGIYTGQTVEELVRDICNIPYFVQSKLKRIKLYGWLPVSTRRANLAQVLFAVGAHLKVDLNGVLRVETLWEGVASAINPDRVFWGDRVRYVAKTTEVSVLEHQYIPGTEEVKLFEGTTVNGDLIQFSEPVHTLTASGFSILEQGANFARVSGGSGTLTGLKYVHTTRDVRVVVTPDDVANVVEVKDATLVSLVNSAAVAERLAGYYKLLETMDGEVVYGGERPGDVVAFEHPYGGESMGCVKSASIALGGRLVADETTAIGYRPPKFEDTELLETRAVLTGSGTWVPPEGVTSVRAVLIGGGANGQNGADGTVGNIPWARSDTDGRNQELGENAKVSASVSVAADTPSPTAGKGGAGGIGGAGGKIMQKTIAVIPLEPIHFSCGGAVPYGDESETVFGALSSAAGARSASGYTDPVTGETFALPGQTGVSGGDGGTANKAGADAGSAKGGSGAMAGKQSISDSKSSTNHQDRMVWYEFSAEMEWGSGAGGGGAGGDGTDGGTPYFSGEAYSGSLSTTFGGTAMVRCLTGGTGGNGTSGAAALLYGCGGNGGGGGGGAGANSTATVNASQASYWEYQIQDGSGGTLILFAKVTAYANSGGAPVAGKGGAGGAGMEGCIILYYGLPKRQTAGAVYDKTGAMFLDKRGRRLVV